MGSASAITPTTILMIAKARMINLRRRFGVHALTHAVKQLYAVTYPGHTDLGAEHEIYGEAEAVALELAQGQRRSVWYAESSQSCRRTLVRSFRDSD